MEFCMRLASEVIVEGINENPDENFLMSPLSLNCLLNMMASGATGPTLDQLLGFLQYEDVSDANADSSRMIRLAATSEESSRKDQKPISSSSENYQFTDTISKDSRSKRKRKQPMGNQRTKSRLVFTPPFGSESGPKLCFVGGIWVDNKFPMKPSFEQTAKDVYKADARTVNFASERKQVVKEVNNWAENETQGLIKDLIPSGSIRKHTKIVLANALYFKGEWRRPFETSLTKRKDFHLGSGATVKVPLMTARRRSYPYASFESFKILKLPYKSGQDNKQFSMYVFLPKRKDGLKEMMQNFISQPIFLKKNLKLQDRRLAKVRIPKFKFSYGSFEASGIMKELGLTLPFQQNIGGFKEMVDSPHSHELYVSRIFQKSCVEVNEQGTKAAVVSIWDVEIGCSPPWEPKPRLPSFVANHPFMFMIKEEVSGAVFFAGTVLNPLNKI